MKKNLKQMRSAINEESYHVLLADIVGLIKEAQQTIPTLFPKAAKMRPPRVSAKRKRKARKP